jgi:hypothetical protein
LANAAIQEKEKVKEEVRRLKYEIDDIKEKYNEVKD